MDFFLEDSDQSNSSRPRPISEDAGGGSQVEGEVCVGVFAVTLDLLDLPFKEPMERKAFSRLPRSRGGAVSIEGELVGVLLVLFSRLRNPREVFLATM